MPTKPKTTPMSAAKLRATPLKQSVDTRIADGETGNPPVPLGPAPVSDFGEEIEVALSDELGGGDSFEPARLPPGKYVLAGGVTIWPLRRGEDGEFEALFPLLTLLSLECRHEPRLCRRVTWGPESKEWTVVEIDGIPVLVRPGDLAVYTDGETVEV